MPLGRCAGATIRGPLQATRDGPLAIQERPHVRADDADDAVAAVLVDQRGDLRIGERLLGQDAVEKTGEGGKRPIVVPAVEVGVEAGDCWQVVGLERPDRRHPAPPLAAT